MTATRASGGGRGVWIAGLLLVVGIVAVVLLTARQETQVPFDPGSSAPDGYRALAILLRERGSDVASISPARFADEVDGGSDVGDVVVVADPDLLTEPEYRSALGAAESGAVVVLGAPRTLDDGMEELDDPFAVAGVGGVPGRMLADTPAEPSAQGDCTISRLSGLGPIDTAFAGPVDPADQGPEARRCYGDISGAYVVSESMGDGTLVTLGSPYLWVNARLQPDKENGGQPLDNAVVALRLLGPTEAGATVGTSITFVDATPTAGVAPDGSKNPLELMPVGVKLAILQLIASFVIYAWWRSRRLGPVVVEQMPVEIAGSELVVAVGDLLRRKGTPQRAADVLRSDARRELGRRLGLPPDASPGALVDVVVARTGRDRDEVGPVLQDGPVSSAEALVRLAASLSDIRQEVLEHHVVR